MRKTSHVWGHVLQVGEHGVGFWCWGHPTSVAVSQDPGPAGAGVQVPSGWWGTGDVGGGGHPHRALLGSGSSSSRCQVIENCPVSGIRVRTDDFGVRRVAAVETEHGSIQTPCVVNCAGGRGSLPAPRRSCWLPPKPGPPPGGVLGGTDRPTEAPPADWAGSPTWCCRADLSLFGLQVCGPAPWAGWLESRSRWWPCTMPMSSPSASRASR